ncbi:MAG: prepilin peptidase [Beijerinckiaceae bacterium]|nr:prepilin peptidase [Beijerinckiaceae bacterium]
MSMDLLLLLFPAVMAFAAFSDLFTMTIPNRVSLLLIAAFVALAVVTGMPLKTFGLHLAAGFVVLAITFTMFAFGWIGGGDAKLAAATGIWCGFGVLLEYLLIASVLGGLLTLAILYWRAYHLPIFALKVHWIFRLHHHKTGIPYGIALAVAGLIVYPQMAIWQRIAGL